MPGLCKGLALQDGRLSASRYSQRDRGNVGSERTVTPAGRRSRVHCQCSAPVACGSVIWDCPADARATDCSVADIGDAWLRSQERQQTMEPLWSPVVAPGGKRPQAVQARGSLKQAKTVAVVAIGSPKAAHGKEGLDGSSPSRDLAATTRVLRALVGLGRHDM